MNDISREDALAHFGVKGMRWGVRKQPTTSSDTTAKPAEKKSWRPTDKQKKVAAAGAILLATLGYATYKDKKEYGNWLWDEIADERRNSRAERENQALVKANSPIRDLYLR